MPTSADNIPSFSGSREHQKARRAELKKRAGALDMLAAVHRDVEAAQTKDAASSESEDDAAASELQRELADALAEVEALKKENRGLKGEARSSAAKSMPEEATKCGDETLAKPVQEGVEHQKACTLEETPAEVARLKAELERRDDEVAALKCHVESLEAALAAVVRLGVEHQKAHRAELKKMASELEAERARGDAAEAEGRKAEKRSSSEKSALQDLLDAALRDVEAAQAKEGSGVFTAQGPGEPTVEELKAVNVELENELEEMFDDLDFLVTQLGLQKVELESCLEAIQKLEDALLKLKSQNVDPVDQRMQATFRTFSQGDAVFDALHRMWQRLDASEPADDSLDGTGASKDIDSDDDPLNQTHKSNPDREQKPNEQVGEERLNYVLNLITRMSDKIVGYQRRLAESHAEIKQLLEDNFNLQEHLVSRGVSPEVFRPSRMTSLS